MKTYPKFIWWRRCGKKRWFRGIIKEKPILINAGAKIIKLYTGTRLKKWWGFRTFATTAIETKPRNS